jgi:SAM-dependent methyltransferase
MNEAVQRQRDHYERQAVQYVDSRRRTPGYARFMDAWADRLLEPWLRSTSESQRRAQRVLDPMCGHANMAPYVLRWSPHLILNDLSPTMLSLIDADIRRQCHVLPASDAARLALDDGSIDVIVFSGSLHHAYRNLRDVLCEAHRLLKPGGLLLFGEPSNEFIVVRLIRNCIYRLSHAFEHQTERAFRWGELRTHLQVAGFAQIDIQPFGSIGYMLMGQVGVVPLLRNVRSERLFEVLNSMDRMIERSRLLRRTCFALIGSAVKPPPGAAT